MWPSEDGGRQLDLEDSAIAFARDTEDSAPLLQDFETRLRREPSKLTLLNEQSSEVDWAACRHEAAR